MNEVIIIGVDLAINVFLAHRTANDSMSAFGCHLNRSTQHMR